MAIYAYSYNIYTYVVFACMYNLRFTCVDMWYKRTNLAELFSTF